MEGRYLLGVTDPAQTLAFLRRCSDAPPDAAALARRSALAAERRAARPPLQGAAEPVPAVWQEHLDQVATRPVFQSLYPAGRWRFAAVPLRALLTVQAHLNFSHSAAALPPEPSTQQVLDLCLPAQPEPLELWGGMSEGEPPSASFYTGDPNVQITGARLETRPQLALTFTISKTALFAHVLAWGGRLYLKDGTHRAVALALRGCELLPCVMMESADGEDLPQLLPRGTLAGASPPALMEFLDPDFYAPHPWVQRIKFIRLVPEEFFAALPPPREG